MPPRARRSASKVAPAPEEIRRLAELVLAEARRDGVVPLAGLARLGVPKEAREAVLRELSAEAGIEITKRALRRAVREQIAERLEGGGSIALRSMATAAVGATKREITDAVDALVAEGGARLVVRGTEVVLVGPSVDALDAPTLDRLERALTDLVGTLKLARKRRATLLPVDVRGALLPFAAAPPTIRAPSPSLDDVLATVARNRESSGLTFVPTLVRALGGSAAREAVHDALLRGARSGVLELRPESGMGRLGPDDVELCPVGPHGSRLSWVRCLQTEASA